MLQRRVQQSPNLVFTGNTEETLREQQLIEQLGRAKQFLRDGLAATHQVNEAL